MSNSNDSNKKPGLGAIVMSTLAAALGVQSRKNQERDFNHGNIATYIISGIVFTVVFIGCVVLVVNLVLGQTS